MASKIKISDVPDKPKATFLRKSAFLTTGDESFRFNFNLAPEQVDSSNCNSVANNENTDVSKETINNSSTKADEVASTKIVNEDNSKNFKFSFSNSNFKFNFNVDNS